MSKGICQLCEQSAPFEKNGIPFLHVHHIEYRSNGEKETIENSIAICSNCHAIINQLERNEDKKQVIKKVRGRN
ncbi:HNH endonuclease [Lactovum miscens]|uniref:HNH endonuclease n=1 Tax=Lactovum miscens TaxID=190387 RepID=UPI0039C9D06C